MASFAFRPPPVAARVEKATSRHLIGPDWTMNMGICDSINSDQRQAKDAIKAIKKRLQQKKPKVQFLTLTLLETVMKNCGDYVHQQVIERNILQEMIKIFKKTEMQVSNKILELLDSWQEAFGGQGGKYPQYYWAYAELRRSGMAFPQRSLDNPPIFIPPSQPTVSSAHPQAGYDVSTNASRGFDEGMASDIGKLSVSDLNHIQNVMELLSAMVQAVNPNDRAAAKGDVITELVNQCHSNQKRLVQFLNLTGDEELLRQGIELNDNLQSLLAKHDALVSGTSLPPEVSKPVLKGENPMSPFVVNNQFEEEQDDDEFAQLARRNSKFTAKKNNSVNSSNTFSSNWSNATTATSSSSTSESSSSESKALVLFEHSAPVKTQKEEPDMINLLSFALTTSEPSPQTFVTLPSDPSQQVSSTSASATPSGQGKLYSSQTHPTSQGFSSYNNYVAPLAQHALLAPQQQFFPQPQSSQFSYSYPTIPAQQWAAPSVSLNPIPSSTYQQTPDANYLSLTLQHYTSFDSRTNYAPAFEVTRGNEKLEVTSVHGARPLQSHNSLGLMTNYGPTAGGETELNSKPKQTALQSLQSYNPFPSNTAPTASGGTQENTNLKQAGTTTSQKPYYHPDSLFADLIDFRSSGNRANLSSRPTLAASGQPMIKARQ